MPSENARPWYKKPAVWLVVVGVAAIIVTIVIWVLSREAEYTLSVRPMRATIERGGVATTMVQVTSKGGYQHPVNLTATGQPSEMVVNFSSLSGVVQPPYSSIMTVNVGKNVGAGNYKIVIGGTGADGMERSCPYILTVAEQQRPSAPPSPLVIKITAPLADEEVAINVDVSGTISGPGPEVPYLWLVINPHTAPGLWWPQGGRIAPYEGRWRASASLGGEEDKGTQFDMAVVLVNEEDNEYYVQYLRAGERGDGYPGKPLPPSARIEAQVTLKRK